jgi:hypothetical protein
MNGERRRRGNQEEYSPLAEARALEASTLRDQATAAGTQSATRRAETYSGFEKLRKVARCSSKEGRFRSRGGAIVNRRRT